MGICFPCLKSPKDKVLDKLNEIIIYVKAQETERKEDLQRRKKTGNIQRVEEARNLLLQVQTFIDQRTEQYFLLERMKDNEDFLDLLDDDDNNYDIFLGNLDTFFNK
jgi:hypothetical protein